MRKIIVIVAMCGLFFGVPLWSSAQLLLRGGSGANSPTPTPTPGAFNFSISSIPAIGSVSSLSAKSNGQFNVNVTDNSKLTSTVSDSTQASISAVTVNNVTSLVSKVTGAALVNSSSISPVNNLQSSVSYVYATVSPTPTPTPIVFTSRLGIANGSQAENSMLGNMQLGKP